MDLLQQARQEIEQVDREMAELFVRRMHAARLVAEYKQANGLPVLDAKREQALLAAGADRVADAQLREYYVLFQQHNMDLSKQYQRKLIQGMRVAYCGAEGAFAHIAAQRIFPGTEKLAFADFAAAYRAVETGECDCAVLPIENSYAGEVGQVIDLLYFGALRVNGVYELAIVQNLLGLPGSRPQDIKTVLSHPQALNQCAAFLHGRHYATMEFSNTALAAEYVAQQRDASIAAIGSAETAEIFGLDILARNINASQSNTTRFAVVSRAQSGTRAGAGGDHSILLFTVPNRAGALARAMEIIGKFDYNISTLRSRPMKQLLWEYYFYLEVEGDLHGDNGAAMLAALRQVCEDVKVAGSFRKHCQLTEEAN